MKPGNPMNTLRVSPYTQRSTPRFGMAVKYRLIPQKRNVTLAPAPEGHSSFIAKSHRLGGTCRFEVNDIGTPDKTNLDAADKAIQDLGDSSVRFPNLRARERGLEIHRTQGQIDAYNAELNVLNAELKVIQRDQMSRATPA